MELNKEQKKYLLIQIILNDSLLSQPEDSDHGTFNIIEF